MQNLIYLHTANAKVAELADALGSGSSGRKPVGVQIPPFALFKALVTAMCWSFFYFNAKAKTAKTSIIQSMVEISFLFPVKNLMTVQLKNPQISPWVME